MQVVIIVCSETQKSSFRVEMSKYDVPYVIVTIEKLKLLSSQSEMFAEKVRKVLKRSLIRAGSVPYVHSNLAVV